MIFVLRNYTSDARLTAPVLTQIAAALEAQANEDISPEWGGGYVVRYEPDTAKTLADNEIEAAILPNTDVAGALGYHATDARGKPYIKCFMDYVDAIGLAGDKGQYFLTVTLSHELAETIGDPGANRNADMTNGQEDAIELSDRVEDTYYEKGGVYVSNFLTQDAFDPGSSGPYCFMDVGQPKDKWLLPTYDALTPGGYAIRRTIGADVQASHAAIHKTTTVVVKDTAKLKDDRWLLRKRFAGSRTAKRGARI